MRPSLSVPRSPLPSWAGVEREAMHGLCSGSARVPKNVPNWAILTSRNCDEAPSITRSCSNYPANEHLLIRSAPVRARAAALVATRPLGVGMVRRVATASEACATGALHGVSGASGAMRIRPAGNPNQFWVEWLG
jgi:hypothetical protein